MRDLIIPAHRFVSAINRPLRIPSVEYTSLRSTLVAVELLLLRTLGFQTRISNPLDHFRRQLDRSIAFVFTAPVSVSSSRRKLEETGEQHEPEPARRASSITSADRVPRTTSDGEAEGEIEQPEDFDSWTRSEKEEYGVVPDGVGATHLGNEVRREILAA